MGITQRDFEALQPGAAGIAQLLMGGVQKRSQAQLEKELEVQKAQEMLPIQKQGEQQKADIDVAKQGKLTDENLRKIQEIQKQLGDKYTVSLGAGGHVSISEKPIDYGARMGQEGRALLPIKDKILHESDIHTQAMERAQKYLEDPTNINVKHLAIDWTKMDEGERARVQQGVIMQFMQKGADEKTAGQAWNNILGKITGQVPGQLDGDQIAAMHRSMQVRVDQAKKALEEAPARYRAAAILAAPTLMGSPQGQQSALDAFNIDHTNITNRLKNIQSKQDSSVMGNPAKPAPQLLSETEPNQGLGAWLLSKAGLSNKKATSAPQPQAQSLQSLIQPPQPTQPQQKPAQMRGKDGTVYNLQPDGTYK